MKQGASTLGFVLTAGAVALGYEAIMLIRGLTPISVASVTPSGKGGPSTPGTPVAGQTQFQDLPANVQGWISAGIDRAIGQGQIKPVDRAAWQNALAGILGHENGSYSTSIVASQPAPNGEHATGLFQILPSTFRRFVPGGDITNPVDSVYAGIQEILNNWGGDPWAPLRNNPYQGY